MFQQPTSHSDLLDCDVGEIDSHSLNQSLNHINRVVAKISFGKILLYPENNQIHSKPKEADGDLKEVPLEMVSNLDSSRIRFINNLVSIWQLVVKKFPLVTTSSAKGKSIDGSTLYKYLEVFILNCIFEITTELHDGLVQLQRVPFLG